MPATRTKHDWTVLISAYPSDDGNMLIESMKPSKITKRQLTTCYVCNVAAPHKMLLRERSCRDKACKEASGVPCDWHCKTHECQELNLMTVTERGDHLTPRRGVEPACMTEAMKAFATDLAAQGLKPSRIRNGMMSRFGLDQESLPSLQMVQRFVNYYTRSQLRNNDYNDEAKKDIWDAGFTGEEPADAPFTFSWRLTADGKPWVDRGTDEDNFLVGISTKNLLRKAVRDQASFVLPMDATFKLSQACYPVFVVGISGSNRSFHLLAIFISSRRKEENYTEALRALRRVYSQVVEQPLKISYVMADAEDAQWNAFQLVFGADNDFTTLMCYFHVAAKVFERTRHLPGEVGHLVMRGLQNTHFTRDESKFLETKEQVMSKWRQKLELATLIDYFNKQWLTGKFHRWQCFHTPRGFATTNNPVEQFNRALKRDYTLHRRLKMGVLLVQMSSCCKHESINVCQFATIPAPTTALKRRMHELRRQGLIYQHVPSRANVTFLLNDAELSGDVVYVFQKASVRVYDPESSFTESRPRHHSFLPTHHLLLEAAVVPSQQDHSTSTHCLFS